jgi:biopolymer transport protein TolR
MPAATRGRRLMGEINVVPYIDVMLVLLIIFMVTAPLLTQGVQVELPEADAKPIDPNLLKNREPLVMSVDAAGRYYLNLGSNEQRPVDEQTLAKRVAIVLGRDPETPVLVKADARVPYGRVVKGMVLLQQAGARKIGFVTDPAAAKALEELERAR